MKPVGVGQVRFPFIGRIATYRGLLKVILSALPKSF